MRARPLEIGILVVAALAIGFLAYANQAGRSARPASVPSTFDTGRNGYRALYEVLRQSGVPVRRLGRVAARLDPSVRTLVMAIDEDALDSGTPLSGGPDEGADLTGVLQRFVRGGGRLIEIDTQFAGASDVAPNVGTSKAAPKGTTAAIALASFPETRGVDAVEGPIDAIFPFASSVGVPLLANRSGVVATRSPYGKGDVIAVTAPALFSNAYLARAQNATFAYDLVAGRGPVAFDDYLYGYEEDFCEERFFGFGCLYRAMPHPVQVAAWIVLGALALALIGANVPFAPPVPLEPPDERDTSAYVASMGALMRRARAGKAAIAAFAGDARRRARSRTNQRFAGALAELDRLAEPAHPSEAAVLRAAHLHYELRKDVP
ncbi:MAG: DUF4350 domain-containing protein [Candidatus Eremiobacteraeota bacterium]|nr:DUF4350 domain-containing protein [Candidatus Eremiobacteraeota bacterium]